MKFKQCCLVVLATVFIVPIIAESDTLRVYLMGNSLTDNIDHEGLIQLVEAMGHTQIHGSHRIPGTPMDWLYNHPDNGFSHNPYGRWGEAFANYQWDAVSVQPFLRPLAGDLEYASKFMDTAKVLSPDVQFYIYAQWPKEGYGDFAEVWLQDVSPWIRENERGFSKPERTKMYYETLVDTLRKARPDMKPVLLSPVGHVFYVLDQKIKAGLVPGHSSIWEFVTGTHVNNVGSYIAGLTYAATLYGENTVGLPVVEPYRHNPSSGLDLPIGEDLARIIQESVWEVVATHPMSGITSDDPVSIVSPIIENAFADNEYRFLFLPGFGAFPYKWEIVSGALPEGLVLSESGKITGQTDAVGEHTFTVRVTDNNGANAQKEFTLIVENDIAPTITTESPLPEASKALYYSLQFESSGGNGSITWEFADTTYPPGMELTPSGLLTGSSGLEGEYTFTVRAFDSDITTPDTVQKTFSLTFGPPTHPLIAAPLLKRDDAPDTDGALDDICWDLQTNAEKLVQGQSFNNTVSFDVIWTDRDLHIAVQVLDESVTDDDRVVVYLDALNNREEIYNWDDRKISINASNGSKVDDECIGSTSRINAGAASINGGYSVEVKIDWRNIGLNTLELLNRVIGFDIAVIDVDEENGETTQVVWQGDDRNSIDTRKFGALVLNEDGNTNVSTTAASPTASIGAVHLARGLDGRFEARFPYESDWTVRMYRLDGRLVLEKKATRAGRMAFSNASLGGNMYLLRMNSPRHTFSTKLFVR